MPFPLFSKISSRLPKTKASLAPVFYCFLQLFLSSAIVFACPYFIDFHIYIQILLFWTIAAITIILYFVTHCKDPGYIPHDAVFFTDQDELSQRQTPGAWKKFESIGSLRGPFSLPSTTDLASSGMKTEKIVQKSTLLDGKRLSILGNGGVINNTNLGPIGLKPLQPAQDGKEPSENNEPVVKPEDNTALSFKIVLKELDNIFEHDSKMIETVIECEASLEEVDEISQHKIQTLKLDTKMRSDKEEIMEDNEKREIQVKPKANSPVARRSLHEIPNKLENKISTEAFHSVPTMYAEENNVSRYEIPGKDNNEEDVKRGVNILDRISSGNQSPQARTYTDEESTGVRFTKVNTNSPRLTRETEPQREEPVIRPISLQSRNRLMSNDEDRNSPAGTRLLETQHNRINSYEGDPSSSVRKHLSKDQISLLDWNLSFRTPKNNKGQESPSADEAKEQGQGETVYVERRYCNACCLDQPFRAKHCRDCGKCVARYDHHCPWLGTCIGEKNHFVFYWFLVFQIAELVWPVVKLYEQVFEERESWFSLSLVLAVPLSIILVMIILLWSFQSYLATVNLTTWESLSWEKISYLKEWKSEWGSPFTRGLVRNLRFFCCESKAQLQKWRLPKFKKRVNA